MNSSWWPEAVELIHHKYAKPDQISVMFPYHCEYITVMIAFDTPVDM